MAALAESLLPRRCKACRAEQVYRDSRWTITRQGRGHCRSHTWRPIGTATTQRNRKLECHACAEGTVLYCSRAQIQRGLPSCPCGAVAIPASLDDAWLAFEAGHLTDADLAAHPETELYARFEVRAANAQQGHAAHGQVRNAPEMIAAGYVARERYEDNTRRRLAAILPTPEPMPF